MQLNAIHSLHFPWFLALLGGAAWSHYFLMEKISFSFSYCLQPTESHSLALCLELHPGLWHLGKKTQALGPSPQDTVPQLPSRYQDFLEVFEEKNADILSPQWNYDWHIDPQPCSLWVDISYVRTITESPLGLHIQENLVKGFIWLATSLVGALDLFVIKKDGMLCLCVNYQALNQITIQNSQPLPLISELLDWMWSTKIFT